MVCVNTYSLVKRVFVEYASYILATQTNRVLKVSEAGSAKKTKLIRFLGQFSIKREGIHEKQEEKVIV